MAAALLALLLAAQTADAALLDAARDYVQASSAPGVAFDLQVGAVRKNWALLRTIHGKGKDGEPLDDALVYLRREKGKWRGAIFGTAVTDDDLKRLGAPKLTPRWPLDGTPCTAR